ncbi:hypothetical protein CW304_24730 [Bacillus sp. UFRGS-B20]|nr:hypothetical protein CW304_24730 [Bacillus sp. UFRGS-B20]
MSTALDEGTGNLAGVAIRQFQAGGPEGGSILDVVNRGNWGASAFCRETLAQHYKVKGNAVPWGPAYYMGKGFKETLVSVVFSV